MKVKVFQMGKGPGEPEFEGEVRGVHWAPDAQCHMAGFIQEEKGVLNIGLGGNLKCTETNSTLFIKPLFPAKLMERWQNDQE